MWRNEIRAPLKTSAREASLCSSAKRGKNKISVSPRSSSLGTFLHAKLPQRLRARRKGCFRRLWRNSKVWVLLTDWVKTEKVNFQGQAASCGTGITYSIYMTLASRLNLRLLQAEVFNERKPSTSPMNACLRDGRLNMPRHECRVKGILKTKL